MKFVFTILFLVTSVCSFAGYTLQDKRHIEQEAVAELSDQDHYSAMISALEQRDWKRLESEARVLAKHFSKAPYARDVTYYLAVAYFNLGEYELANSELSDYLTHQATPKFFESAIQHKFEIAEAFRAGKRKHFLGVRTLPKWVPASSDAVEIYDEVISALPHHQLAAHSLFGKAQILALREEFRSSIESYQTLIRRFPKHPLAIESYIGIGGVYLQRAQAEYPDPDYLDLAELNLRKFRESFPQEERVEVARLNLIHMQEHYASCFYDTARFYERTKKWGAAKIYYKKILATYPNSEIAKQTQGRLDSLQKKIDRVVAKKGR